jgi:hypothetical protein
VFYFFRRGSQTIRYEVRSSIDGMGYEIVIYEQNGAERIEQFTTSDQVHERWMEIHKTLEVEGWWGPATQDGRG